MGLLPPRTHGAHFQLFSTRLSAPVHWRLLSGNNREAARGAVEYVDADVCRVAIKQMLANLDEFQSRIRRIGTNQWRWELVYPDGPVAASGHGFDRQIRCEQAIRRFLLAAPDAHIGAMVMVSASRRWASDVHARIEAGARRPASRSFDGGTW